MNEHVQPPTSTLPGYRHIRRSNVCPNLVPRPERLCAKYIHEPDTIITSGLTREQDGRLWTIGVITTMDLVPAEQGASILAGSRYPRGLCQRREIVCEEGC